MDAHTDEALAVVCTFGFLVVPAFVLATDEADLPEPPSPAKRKASSMAQTGAVHCLATCVDKVRRVKW